MSSDDHPARAPARSTFADRHGPSSQRADGGSAYSITWPTRLRYRSVDDPEITSLARTPPAGRRRRDRHRLAGVCGIVCVAARAHLARPMPNASAPNAPCVDVCDHRRTCETRLRVPISVRSRAHPLPRRSPRMSVMSSPSRSSRGPPSSSARPIVHRPSVVGTLWSIVATVRSGRRTGRPSTGGPRRLRARHLMDEMQIDVEQIRLAGRPMHTWRSNLLGQVFGSPESPALRASAPPFRCLLRPGCPPDRHASCSI